MPKSRRDLNDPVGSLGTSGWRPDPCILTTVCRGGSSPPRPRVTIGVHSTFKFELTFSNNLCGCNAKAAPRLWRGTPFASPECSHSGPQPSARPPHSASCLPPPRPDFTRSALPHHRPHQQTRGPMVARQGWVGWVLDASCERSSWLRDGGKRSHLIERYQISAVSALRTSLDLETISCRSDSFLASSISEPTGMPKIL